MSYPSFAEARDNWQDTWMGEALFFGLLGRLLYSQLDQEWLASIIAEGVFQETPYGEEQAEIQAGLALMQEWSAGFNAETFEDMRADYTRLFVGVGKVLAPPWESVYFGDDRLVFQEQTLQVRNTYARFGLQAENLHREPDDHIGLEMSFMAHLAKRSVAALENEDESAYQTLVEARRDFLKDHLLLWAFQWCSLVDQHARTSFYRGLAHLARGALLESAAQFDLKVRMEPVK